MPTPNATVETAPLREKASMSPCAVAGQILAALHSLLSEDLSLTASTPNTVPTAIPATPTAPLTIAGV